jgi:hypothetical protein
MPSANCLACQVTEARRTNAVLKVPKTVPNPKWVERYETFRLEGMSEGQAKEKATWRRWSEAWKNPRTGMVEEKRRVVYTDPTMPNPDLDRAVREILNTLPTQCELHAKLQEARTVNVMLQVQSLAEQVQAQHRKLKAAYARAGLSEKSPLAPVLVFPYGTMRAPLQGETYKPALKPMKKQG